MTTTSADHIRWRNVKSSNVAKVGWLPVEYAPAMFVKFKSGQIYCYVGVSRQRAVAATRAKSVGKYLHAQVIGKFKTLLVGG